MNVIGFALLLVGLLQMIPAWLWYRLPDTRFWACWWTPFWRIDQNLTPSGVALWIGGSAHMYVGLLLLVEWHSPNPS